MANIQTYLDNIARAIYGEEVRSSIYNAIDLINKMGEVNLTLGKAVNSETSPSTDYFDNSVYINETTWDVWRCKGTGSGWTLIGNLKGSSIGAVTKTGVKPNTNNLIDQYSITTENGVEIGTFEIVNGCPIVVNRNKNKINIIVKNPDGTNSVQDITQPNKFGSGTAITATNSSLGGYYTGDLYLNTSTNDFWRCDNDSGTMWTKIANVKGAQGIQGIQGYSIDSVSKQGSSGLVDTYVITNDNGDTVGTFTVNNGEKGAKGDKGDRGDNGTNGFSPTVESSKSGKVTTVTITDITGPHVFELRDGNDGDTGGTMLKETYDADDDGVVDMAMVLSPNSIDTVPTAGSGHMVTSGGLYTYLGNLDDLNTEEKTNLVAAINEAAESAGHSDEYVQKKGDTMSGGLTTPSVLIGDRIGSYISNTLGVGNGLTFSKTNQIILGKYNEANSNSIFEYGNGTSSTNKSNLLTINDMMNILIGPQYNKTGTTKGRYALGIGEASTAEAQNSFAQGYYNKASGTNSHAEGYYTEASEENAHAEGINSKASGKSSHAEGSNTKSTGQFSHSEGSNTTASGNYSHAEGYGCKAVGNGSHAEGQGTTAGYIYQHVSGRYNNNKAENLFEIGNGTLDVPSNAFEVGADGNVRVAGILTVHNQTLPAITFGLEDLIAGESELEDGTIYFVYDLVDEETEDGEKIYVPADYATDADIYAIINNR